MGNKDNHGTTISTITIESLYSQHHGLVKNI